MIAILELPSVRQRVSKLSVAEYHQLGEFNENRKRTELIRGVVIEKMSKSPLHATIGSLIHQLIAATLPHGWLARKEEPLTFRDSEPEPDVSVVAGKLEDYVREHPKTAALVVEVAVSSPELDRENAALYAENGVAEYWIVLAKEKAVEVYCKPQDGSYQEQRIITGGDTLECASVPSVRVNLAELFAAA